MVVDRVRFFDSQEKRTAFRRGYKHGSEPEHTDKYNTFTLTGIVPLQIVL